jgi:hypothetical protein
LNIEHRSGLHNVYHARYSFDRFLGKKAVFMSFFRAKKRVFWYKMSKKRAFFAFFEAKLACFWAILVHEMCLKWFETICKLLVYSSK